MSKHVVNGNPGDGWYCYECPFFTRDVEEAANHDGVVEKYVEKSDNRKYSAFADSHEGKRKSERVQPDREKESRKP